MIMFSSQFFSEISTIGLQQWNTLAQHDLFCRYEWLAALEHSQCVTHKTGWQPQHLAIYQDSQLIALVPGYIKSHSYGEYVFDWSWAEAYENHHLAYYPKWLSGIPFTPITGRRILTLELTDEIVEYICQVLQQAMTLKQWSSTHINFLTEAGHFSNTMMVRHAVQFHWQNKYFQCFDDFLATMTARKRKMIKKERNHISAQSLDIVWLSGDDISTEHMQGFFACYQQTYLKRSGHSGYLNWAFFNEIKHSMSNNIHLCIAYSNQALVAASLYLSDGDTLYGRYWGSLADYQHLHFELCYYQGIEFAIHNKLNRFDAGAQGEHKLTRGFEPVITYSAHQVAHPMFASAITDFIARERTHVAQYAEQCLTQLPFKDQ
ncbi:N-acetyltransferase [Pseudoalteromonas sp. MMG012]|nr:GNAT family N-acetyltransferase [Pseudoalteromonas sp. MMG012]MBQ4849947.1 N-acetyltransferase [Pseudoalteromonas sp. MMG012]